MGIYQVIKNNGKRAVRNKTNVVLLITVPIVIWIVAMISLQVKNPTVRVGIVPDTSTTEEEIDEVKKELGSYDGIEAGVVNLTYEKTEYIMGKYHQYVHMSGDRKGEIQQITNGLTTSQSSMQTQVSESKQVVALLCTVFLVLASVHSANYIKDKKHGVVERYQMSGQSSLSYSVGYAIYTFVFVVVQSSICLGLLCLGVDNISIQLGQFILIILALSLMATGISTIVTHITKNEMQANLLTSGIAVLCMLLSGTFVLIENMPVWMQQIALCNPFEWILGIL